MCGVYAAMPSVNRSSTVAWHLEGGGSVAGYNELRGIQCAM